MEENPLSEYTNLTHLDLHSQDITDLEELSLQYFSKLPNLQSLNLSENQIASVPMTFARYLKQLEILNLNNNRIENVFDTIDSISLLPNMKSLYLNLNKEEQVDYILKKLPNLEYLNGLQVDRDEIYGANDSKGSQRLFDQVYANEENDQLGRIQPNNTRQSRNPNEMIDLMMTEIRETAKEDYNNTQQLSEQQQFLDTQEINGVNDTVIQDKSSTQEDPQLITAIKMANKQPKQQQLQQQQNNQQFAGEFQDPDLNQIIYNQNQRKYSRKNSAASRASRKNLKNQNLHTPQNEDYDQEEDLINPDEFEEIAEIYDSIRLLHSKVDPQKDIYLAQDFDNKLKQVMEDLSEAVNNELLSTQIKRERSISSKFELLTMCAEKICDYLNNPISFQIGNSPTKKGKIQLTNVIGAVFDGFRGIFQDIQDDYREFIGKSEKVKVELTKNQQETHQLLEAAEHLENQNIYNMKRVQQLEKEKDEMQKYVTTLEEDNKKYLDTLIKHSKGYDTRDIVQDLQNQISSNSQRQALPQKQIPQQQSSSSPSRQMKPFSARNIPSTSQKQKNLINQTVSQAMHKPNNSLANDSSHSPVTYRFQNESSYGHVRNQSEMAQNSQINNSLSYHFQSGKKKATNLKGINSLGSSQQRVLTLKQLKDLINDIYQQKTKFDEKCQQSKLPKETMEQYMYTYLNQRYGLKNLIIEWAAAIITGIKKFSKEDHEVALFGKILRNECDEEFRFIQQTVKDTVHALLKAILREKFPLKGEDQIGKMLEQITNDSIETWQWKKIIEKMYDEDDYRQLEDQIYLRLSQQTQTQNTNESNIMNNLKLGISNKVQQNSARANSNSKKLTRNEIQQMSTDNSKSLKFSLFLKTVLDFQLKEHEKFLNRFIQEFKSLDKDNDGIINEEQFRQLHANFKIISKDRIEKMLHIIDPYNNQKITFSDCIHLLSSEIQAKPDGSKVAILELIAISDLSQ